MSILDGFKTCRKGLHQYPADKKQCPECQKANQQRWRKENQNRQRELNRHWREQNREHYLEYCRQWHQNNRKEQLENQRQWRQENHKRQLENMRLWRKKNPELNRKLGQLWREKNPDKKRALQNRRRAIKKQAVPPWANHDAIKEIYAEAVRLERKTGIKYHVDHIYPLQSDYMCGLHVETNLQILTKKENIKKGNRTWPGQLECQRLPLHLNGFEKSSNWGRPS